MTPASQHAPAAAISGENLRARLRHRPGTGAPDWTRSQRPDGFRDGAEISGELLALVIADFDPANASHNDHRAFARHAIIDARRATDLNDRYAAGQRALPGPGRPLDSVEHELTWRVHENVKRAAELTVETVRQAVSDAAARHFAFAVTDRTQSTGEAFVCALWGRGGGWSLRRHFGGVRLTKITTLLDDLDFSHAAERAFRAWTPADPSSSEGRVELCREIERQLSQVTGRPPRDETQRHPRMAPAS